jgi:hypothetical protein
MVLVSQALDNAVGKLDFHSLDGKKVFLDTQYLDGTVDKGYLISSLRQHLLAHGALLQEDRAKATYVVEPRTGGVGTDRHSLMVGTPAVTIPSIAAVPLTSIPEIALMKKTDQKGVAKLAVFAYNRETGRALWQSGLVEANSTLKDTWVFGAGPFSRGSIRKKTELAGEELPTLPSLPLPFTNAAREEPAEPTRPPSAVQPTHYLNADAPAPPRPVPFALLGLTGVAAVVDRPLILPSPQGPATPAGPLEPSPHHFLNPAGGPGRP